MTVGERLLMGAAKIRRGEWCQGTYWVTKTNAVCAMGSLSARYEIPDSEEAIEAAHWLLRALGLTPADRSDSFFNVVEPIACWNDHYLQTAEQVADALELAAILWEQDQKQQQEQAKLVETTVGVGV